MLLIEILPLDVGDVLAHRVERPVDIRVLAVHGRHSSRGLVGLIVGEVRKDEIRLRGHLIHCYRELAEILLEVFENIGVQLARVRLNVRLESGHALIENGQRRLFFRRLALDVERVEHIVAWRVDGLSELAEL